MGTVRHYGTFALNGDLLGTTDFKLASGVIFRSHVEFLMNVVITLLALSSAKNSCIHVWMTHRLSYMLMLVCQILESWYVAINQELLHWQHVVILMPY